MTVTLPSRRMLSVGLVALVTVLAVLAILTARSLASDDGVDVRASGPAGDRAALRAGGPEVGAEVGAAPSPASLELDWIEDIGLCPRGEAEQLLRAGDTTIGGRIPVNPSDGLACFGEAVPAQALAQVCELTWQLRGQAEGRQVEGARVGITANQGLFGHGSSVIVST
ncbi:thiolase C-terminal domain-containing protein [Nocardioides pacificus]